MYLVAPSLIVSYFLILSPSCGNMNFARRFNCNGSNCNVEKRPEFIRLGHQEAVKGGPKNKMPGDWDW